MSLDALLLERRRVLGVLYAEDFDADPEPDPLPDSDVPELEIIEPYFTPAELESAREEGRIAGRAEADVSIAASRLQVLERIAAAMTQAQGEAAVVAEDAAAGTARAMLAALSACLPTLCALHGQAEVQTLIRTVLPSLSDQPRVSVRVHPHLTNAIATELADLDSEFAARVVVLPSDAVAPGDVRVTWENGAAQRDAARACMAVQESLAALGLNEEK